MLKRCLPSNIVRQDEESISDKVHKIVSYEHFVLMRLYQNTLKHKII